LTEQRHKGEFHRADPAWRRTVIVLLLVTAALGIGALVGLQYWLAGIQAKSGGDPVAYQHALTHALAILCFVLAVVALVFAVWTWRLAVATRADRRWPPSSMRTSSDVRIRYLTSADALVSQMKVGAFALVLVALALAAWGFWLLRLP
jgi:magnesium-transporting ATPase (P-type)